MHIGLHDDRHQGPVDPAARLQQRREERPLPQLGDAQLDIAGLGGQQPPKDQPSKSTTSRDA